MALTKAPIFSTIKQDGSKVSLNDFSGEWVLLYFYPKDNTPGCTKQACSLRDGWSELGRAGITVLGISPDNEKSHVKFIEKHELPFDLLVDTDHKIADKYGCWGLKKFMGREYEGIIRTSFLISPDGKIVHTFSKPKVADHANEVLEVFNNLEQKD